MRSRLFPCLTLIFAAVAAAQPPKPAFEVATIKLHPGPISYSADPAIRGSRVTGTASTVLDFITTAYEVNYDQITGGPGWLKSDHYDFSAKAEGDAPLTRERMRQMLQTLLADRFQLVLHRETREVPVYALVAGKSGHKLKESTADAPGDNGIRSGPSGMHMEASRGTMDNLARQLSFSAGRPVVNRTGLTGYYAFKFDWYPAGSSAGPDTPSMFTAIQEQLGLKLDPAKAPFEMIVIDRAERPSEN